MIHGEIGIFISCTDEDSSRIEPVLHQLKANDWYLTSSGENASKLSLSVQSLESCDMVLAFISAAYIADRSVFVSELSYAACALRKPYILVMLEDIGDLPPDLEMLAAKYGFVEPNQIEAAMENRLNAPATEPSKYSGERQYVFKPFEACEEHYAFVSYAHDDALAIYPIIKDLYEAGWNLWYDEGIRITERYLPEIARHVRDCEAFLLFVTERSVKRPFVMDYELAYAQKLGKRITLVMLEVPELFPSVLDSLSAISPDKAEQTLEACSLRNYGERTAISPKDKPQGYEYDLQALTDMPEYEFVSFGDGIALTKYLGNRKDVDIPSEHLGYPVRALIDTFQSMDIESVKIPNTVLHIKWAFHKCKKLSIAVIPDSVSDIGEYSFYECQKLKSISKIYAGNVGRYAFGSCKSIKSIEFMEGVQISEKAFEYCNKIKSIVFYKNPQISEKAFLHCTGLKQVIFMNENYSVEGNAFWECRKLKETFNPGEYSTNSHARFGFKTHEVRELTPYPRSVSVGPKVVNYDYSDELSKTRLRKKPGIIIFPGVAETIETNQQKAASALFVYDRFDCYETYVIMHELICEGYKIKPVYYDELKEEDVSENKIILYELTDDSTQQKAMQLLLSKNLTIIPLFGKIMPGELPPELEKTIGLNQGLMINNSESMSKLKELLKTSNFYEPPLKDFGYTIDENGVSLEDYHGSESVICIPKYFYNTQKAITSVNANIKSCTDIYLAKSEFLKTANIAEGANIHGYAGVSAYSPNISIIPYGKTTIEKEDVSGITHIVMPDTVTQIGESAFAGSHIKMLILPESITSIGEKAFYGCGLEEIIIPVNVESIGDSAFENCTSLKKVIIQGSNVRFGDYVFVGCDDLAGVEEFGLPLKDYRREAERITYQHGENGGREKVQETLFQEVCVVGETNYGHEHVYMETESKQSSIGWFQSISSNGDYYKTELDEKETHFICKRCGMKKTIYEQILGKTYID